MALSIATIYRPLNEFFINRFGEKAGEPVTFRFGRVPRLILDSDLILPTDPSGPSPTLAQELLRTHTHASVPGLAQRGRWWPSEAMARPVPIPLCACRGAQLQAEKGPRVFERSEFARTPPEASTAGCP